MSALITQQDPNIAIHTANNALDNNFLGLFSNDKTLSPVERDHAKEQSKQSDSPLDWARYHNLEEFIEIGLSHEYKGTPPSPRTRQRCVERLSGQYYQLCNVLLEQGAPAARTHFLNSLSLSDLQAIRLKENDPKGIYTPEQRKKLLTNVQSEYDLHRGHRIVTPVIAPLVGVIGATRVPTKIPTVKSATKQQSITNPSTRTPSHVSQPTPSSLTGPRQIEINRRNGQSFQQAVHEHLRIQENHTIYTVNVPGKGLLSTKPDLPISMAGVTDIKNVRKISFTSQLQAQSALAKQQGTSFNLIISPQTETISKSLYKEIITSKGTGKVFEYNPTTQQMIKRFVNENKVIRD